MRELARIGLPFAESDADGESNRTVSYRTKTVFLVCSTEEEVTIMLEKARAKLQLACEESS